MLPYLGNYQAITASKSGRESLGMLCGSLQRAKELPGCVWESSLWLAHESDVVAYLGWLAEWNTFLAVSDDHSMVHSSMFHKSVDFYTLEDVLLFFYGNQEEPV